MNTQEEEKWEYEKEWEENEMPDWQFYGIIGGIVLIIGGIGFWIGRGTAPQIINPNSHAIGYAEGLKSSTQVCIPTATTTILMEKQKCDVAGGNLVAWQDTILDHDFNVICTSPAKQIFDYTIK
jgi:hypothetical protein